MRIALAQMNSRLGGIDSNLAKIVDFTRQAQDKNCHLIVFPELAILGYSPNDLLERPEVVAEQLKALKKLPSSKKITGIVGAITPNKNKNQKPYYNSAVVFPGAIKPCNKTLLPSYDVFDETRFFQAGEVNNRIVKVAGYKVAVLICEDMWAWERTEYQNPLRQIAKQKVDVVVSINASPFSIGKRERRLKVARQTAKLFKAPVVYVNMAGAQDEVIFDGGSFAVDAKGKVFAQSAYFSEDINIIDTEKRIGEMRQAPKNEGELLHGALVSGLRDFAAKNGFSKIHLGLSGGIDSAVAVALAADAVGPQNVTALALPGPYSSSESFSLAEKLAENIGCGFRTLDINTAYEEMIGNYEKVFGKMEFGLAHENVQARLRGLFLMMFANVNNSLLLSTGNKSEAASGYATLYGDMCGGLAPLGDLLKRQVYLLAEHYNSQYELIPKQIIERAPTAELRPNQKDQDSLPPYAELDASVERLVSKMSSAKNATDQWLLKKLAQSEFKRWQAPPILRVSDHAFGRARRMPISNAFYKKA